VSQTQLVLLLIWVNLNFAFCVGVTVGVKQPRWFCTTGYNLNHMYWWWCLASFMESIFHIGVTIAAIC